MKAVDLLKDHDTFTTTVMAILYDKYGTEFIDWDPSTVDLMIYEDFGFFPDNNLKDKVQAGSSLITEDLFYKSFNVFSVTCNILSLHGYSTTMLIPPEADEVAWGCLEAKLLDSRYNPEAFSQEIKEYTGFILEREGIYTPPSILDFADYEENILDSLDEDEEFGKLVMERQVTARKEFSESLRKKVLELFSQLKSIEDMSLDTTFIDQSINQLTQQ